MSTALAAALGYAQRGLSVIPIRPEVPVDPAHPDSEAYHQSKKPLVPWSRFQKERASRDEIEEWWRRWPRARVGIVTGQLSGVVVIDVDPGGQEVIEHFLTDSMVTPTARTPRGGRHYYFRAPGPTRNNSGKLPGVDFRGDGGYVIAPSGNGSAYQWLPDLSLQEVALAEIPERYRQEVLLSAQRSHTLVDTCRRVTTDGDILKTDVDTSGEFQISFSQGKRDDSLFHIALALARGGCSYTNTYILIRHLANHCTPPFPATDVEAKVKSAFTRLSRRERNLAEEVREWVLSTTGNFLSTELSNCLHVSTREERKNVSIILARLCREGIIERTGTRNGCFRRIENECETIDFLNASTEALPLQWPFGIEQYFRCMSKNIIVIAGETDSGKTGFLLNFIRCNMHKHRIHYFSSEVGASELRDRLSLFAIPLGGWTFSARERTSNFADVIQPDDVNVVDFLELTSDFYRVAEHIRNIFDKLRRGIAVIAIQKNPGVELGLGGGRSIEKARLYLAMEPGRLKIVKCKNWADSTRNPNKLQIRFKLAKGCAFIPTSQWEKGGTNP